MSHPDDADDKMEELQPEVDSPQRIHPRKRYVNEVEIEIPTGGGVLRGEGVDRSPISQDKRPDRTPYIDIGVNTDTDRYNREVQRHKVYRKGERDSRRAAITVKIEF